MIKGPLKKAWTIWLDIKEREKEREKKQGKTGKERNSGKEERGGEKLYYWY